VRRERFDKFVDFAAVGLIALATVLTAWCGYQASRWRTLATSDYQRAGAARTIGASHQARANALETIDVGLFLQYIIASEENHPRVRDFIVRRFRPEMQPAFRAWMATHPLTNPAAPSSPFVMPQYRVREAAEGEEFQKRAESSFAAAQSASDAADDYVRLTVFFAAVSFLAGISTRFPYPSHAVVVGVGITTLVVGLVQLAGQPTR